MVFDGRKLKSYRKYRQEGDTSYPLNWLLPTEGLSTLCNWHLPGDLEEGVKLPHPGAPSIFNLPEKN